MAERVPFHVHLFRSEHVFVMLAKVTASRQPVDFRWRQLADEAAPPALIPDETAMERHIGTGEFRGMEFLHVNAKSIINGVPPSSRMVFRHTINVYRGCSHACTYCFARPTHEYLGLGIGRDFERKIVVKINAVERLKAELRSPKWNGELIAMGTNTDPYQHAEGKYHLTQGVIRVLGEHRNPFSILTKSTLVLRDLGLLQSVAQHTPVRLDLSIGTLDRDVAKLTEPGTPPPDRRLAAVRRLNEAGIPCGVLVAPVLPGLSDSEEQLREIAEACVDAGAVSVSPVVLHLRPGVREHYLEWLAATRPDVAALHKRRFSHGAYQPREQQERVARVVKDVLRARGRAGSGPWLVRGLRREDDAVAPGSEPCVERVEQQRLL
jgi:DNA repair photolyase